MSMWKHVCIQVGVCDDMCDGVCRHWCICRYECVCVCMNVYICKGSFRCFHCEQTSRKSGQYFLQFLPSPSKQTNKIIPTSIYGAPNTCPPQGIWKSSDLANLERALGEEGTRGQRVALHAMSVLKITLSLLWWPRQPREAGPDSEVASLLWGNQGSGDMADPKSPGQETEAQGLGTQHCQSRVHGPAITTLSSPASVGAWQRSSASK